MMISKDKFIKYKIELIDISADTEFTIYLSMDVNNITTSVEEAIQHVMGTKEYKILSIEQQQCIVHITVDTYFISPN